MRTIVTVSLPEDVAAELKRTVKREGYASTSEFFRSLLREYKRAKLAKELQQDRETFEKARASGKLKQAGWKEIRSGKDLG